VTAGGARRWTAPRWLPVGLACAATVLAVVHAVVVGRHYGVGSFDDDANYILAARALAHGRGLTSTLPAGFPLIAAYPPGYAALIAPIARIDPTAFLAFRAVSVVMLAGLFPLVWTYFGRRGLPDHLRVAVLVLLALNPVLATFSTMVMAELPFLVCLMALLLLAERWAAEIRTATWAGAATVAAAAYAVWLKEAAVGMVAGLVLWLALRREWRKAAVTAIGTVALLSPIAIARRAVGEPIIGTRYSDEFGGAFAGGLHHQIVQAIPHAIATYLNLAVPQTIAPTSVSPLPFLGAIAATLGTLGTLVTPVVILGFAVWAHRYRDVASVVVPVYLLETLVYPFTNERRLIIILPLLLAWFVVGGWEVARALRSYGRRLGHVGVALPGAAAIAAVVYVGILVPQFGRNYLYRLGQDTSHPQGSPYMSLLSRLGSRSDVVETDFLWTTNLFSGHRTADGAYLASESLCYEPQVVTTLRADDAGYVLTAILSNIPAISSPCLLHLLGGSSGAVRLLRTAKDDSSVWELIGPGTPHPGLRDALAGAPVAGPGLDSAPPIPQAPGDVVGTVWTAEPVGGQATFTWTFAATDVSQVSVGMVGAIVGQTGRVSVDLLGTDGRWRTVASAPGRPPYLLAALSPAVRSVALRVSVDATSIVSVLDVHALGS